MSQYRDCKAEEPETQGRNVTKHKLQRIETSRGKPAGKSVAMIFERYA